MPRGPSRAPKADRLAIGVHVDRALHAEAMRLATENGLAVTQVLRMAISKGLPKVAQMLNDENDG